MTKSHTNGHAIPGGVTGAGFDLAATAFTEAAERGGEFVNAGLRLWQSESARFVEEMLVQGERTLARLCECRTPLDVLQVEQEWLRARSRSYLESSLRFADAFSYVARGAEEPRQDGLASRKASAADRNLKNRPGAGV